MIGLFARIVRAVLNETLRLFPPVPLNVRECRPEPCALPPSTIPPLPSAYPKPTKPFIPTPNEPLYMPGSTPIMYMPLLMQRNPDLWGPDADVFDPERWLDPTRMSILTSNPMMFTPFSAGPRIVSNSPLHGLDRSDRVVSPSVSDRTLRTTRHRSSWFGCCSSSIHSLLHPSSSPRDRCRLLTGRPSRGGKLSRSAGRRLR